MAGQAENAAPNPSFEEIFTAIFDNNFHELENLIYDNGQVRPGLELDMQFDILLDNGHTLRGDFMTLAVVKSSSESYAILLGATGIIDQQPYADIAERLHNDEMFFLITGENLPENGNLSEDENLPGVEPMHGM